MSLVSFSASFASPSERPHTIHPAEGLKKSRDIEVRMEKQQMMYKLFSFTLDTFKMLYFYLR